MTDPRFPNGIPKNGCSACRRDFASIGAFDKHRTGLHEYDFSLARPEGRRCMAEDEMLGAEMQVDGNGRWALVKTPAQLAFYASQSASNESEAA